MKKDNYDIILLKVKRSIASNIKYIQHCATCKACRAHNVDGYHDPFDQIHSIGWLLDMRDSLAYLDGAINRSVGSLSVDDNRLLTAMYINNVDKQRIAKALNISTRTMYRRAVLAKKRLHNNLISEGITYNWLLENIKPIADMGI